MLRIRNKWQGGGYFILAMAATVLLVWWLNEPVAALLRAAGDLRTWLMGFGPLAPLMYVLFYAAQILLAPLPGNFLAVLAGYLFGFWKGLLLSLLGLTVGACLAVLIARTFGRPLLERFFSHAELVRWERKLRLRSPLVWYVFFLFPVPDLVMYVAGLGTLRLRWLLPAILLGRATGILIGITLGNFTATMPPQWVIIQWLLLVLLGALALRFQRPLRYYLLISLRRGRRSTRNAWRTTYRMVQRTLVKTPMSTPVE
jgi:uncharacterized membrane protein YdjX (TVP38/TMEM64 family)